MLKNRLKKDGNELTTFCSQLKLMAVDGKIYATDCFPQNKIEDLIKAIPNKNASAFLDWFTYSDYCPLYRIKLFIPLPHKMGKVRTRVLTFPI